LILAETRLKRLAKLVKGDGSDYREVKIIKTIHSYIEHPNIRQAFDDLMPELLDFYKLRCD